MSKKLILAAAIGNCVHVAGAMHFLNLAADEGYDTLFLGPAVEIPQLLRQVEQHRPYLVSVGYRLTPENVVPLVRQLRQGAERLTCKPRWVFAGTRPVAELARGEHFFDKIFDGTEDLDDCIAFLRGIDRPAELNEGAQTLAARINQKRPYPLLRHHFGLPSFAETEAGIRAISSASVLDVISLGPDQNTQQYFFEPGRRDPALEGAGGVPVRTADEFRRLKAASQTGNRPLMRCYSGTADVMRFAQVLHDTIDNAWCAVPLCWYNELDGRGTRPLETSIAEAQRLMAWHGERGIPVEVNEPHHWGLRDAHDVISVAMAYISARNAKRFGVRHYVAQYMFNIPGSMSFSMDLAKVLAQVELTESLASPDFVIWRETRAGLPFLSADLDVAKGQLAASTMLQMAIHPHIIHVVGYSEAEHAATPDVVIESCRIVRGVIRSTLYGNARAASDTDVQRRRVELVREARTLLQFIERSYPASEDPLTDPAVLADCIRRGILDAPHILKNDKYRGILRTRMQNGACVAYDEAAGRPLSETERFAALEAHGNLAGLTRRLDAV
ncbi:cobalamin B12-binding domain-containing protein [Feifania hominis]|uniref:Methionine synthase n=1 Tax=Feifania hominis TaxID=2763660 RepID=A0A926DE99_9FIRM|nr:cobalamin B12-binding domain-containing protein [Feifania hominis]MBC8536247.1 methionine synthase [Feifania hominis]